MARFDLEALAESLTQDENLHRSSMGTVYGTLEGVPIHVAVGSGDDGSQFLAVVVASTSPETGAEIKDSWVDVNPDLKPRQIEVEPEAVLAKISIKKAAKSEVEALDQAVRDMASAAAAVPSGTPKPTPGARAALVNGVPMYLTEVEAGELTLEGGRLSAEYEELRPNMGRAILFGLAGVLVSALVWGAVAAFLDFQAWLIALGAGLLIGFLVLLGAGKTNRAIQGLIALFTLMAVFLGEVTAVTFVLIREVDVFDPGVAVEIYLEVIGDDPGLLFFPLGGGLFGAWFGTRLGKKPQIEPAIDLAPA